MAVHTVQYDGYNNVKRASKRHQTDVNVENFTELKTRERAVENKDTSTSMFSERSLNCRNIMRPSDVWLCFNRLQCALKSQRESNVVAAEKESKVASGELKYPAAGL